MKYPILEKYGFIKTVVYTALPISAVFLALFIVSGLERYAAILSVVPDAPGQRQFSRPKYNFPRRASRFL